MVRRTLTQLARLSGFIAGLATTLMMVHIVLGVFFRVVLDIPLLGTNVIVSHFYMTALVFLGIFVASWRDEQIRVDVIAGLLPPLLRKITDGAAELISLAFFAALTWGLTQAAWQRTQINEQVDAIFGYVTMWPMRWLAMAGILLAAVAVLWHLLVPSASAENSEGDNNGDSREEGHA